MSWDQVIESLRNRYETTLDVAEPGTASMRVNQCSDAVQEAQWLAESVGVLVSPRFVPMVFEGADSAEYLHRRLSQEINGIPVGQGAQAMQLNGEGRMELDLLLWRVAPPVFFGLVDRQWGPKAVETIEQYVFAEDINVHRQWEAEGVIGLTGPRARALVTQVLESDSDWLRESWGCDSGAQVGGVPCRLFHDPRWPSPFYHLCLPLGALASMIEYLTEKAEALGGGAVGALAYDHLRIGAGVTTYGVDTSEATIPLEAHLKAALNYDKGCYPGQEIIARITNLGHPAKMLVRLNFASELVPAYGTALLHEGQPVGFVTSSVALPGSGESRALGYLKWGSRTLRSVTCEGAAGEITGEVILLSEDAEA